MLVRPVVFRGPTDGLARVVSSGGKSLEIWKLQTSPKVLLKRVRDGFVGGGPQDPGFFTSVSSNGTASPIIWALARPPNNSNKYPIYLSAFDPEAGTGAMTHIYHAIAGTWPNLTGNANLVPVVANGEVFVASYKQLQIFGLTGAAATKAIQKAK
jgi:hypothetical protein